MVSRLSSVVVRARHLVEGTLSGIHKSPHRGSSVEFLEHKRYTPGDDIRNVDWKLLARSDRLYVKQFEDETNLRATLVVDSSASMRYGPEGPSKHRFTCMAAAAFAYMLLSQSDAVGLLSQENERRVYVPPRSDWSHFQAVAGALEDLEPKGKDAWLGHLIELAGSLRKRGMFVLFTDLLVERQQALQALRLLRDRRHEVLLFHVLHPWELEFPFSDPRVFTDPEADGHDILADPASVRESYLNRLRELCSFFREEATGLEVDYHLLPSDSRLEEALVLYLARREARM
jgi:uncharacterized protein (DUF58 family)